MSNERRYVGRTPAEAMRRARTELGEDARLVSARRITPAGMTPQYEVRVTGTRSPAAPAPAAEDAAIAELRREIVAIRETLAARSAAPAAAAPAAPAEAAPADPLASLLRRRGVGEDLSRTLVARAREQSGGDEIARLRSVLQASLALGGPADRPGERTTVVVGPAGSGKTTTLAKIAAEAVARGEQPVLVCADGESLTGEDALASVAEALGLPFETAFLEGGMEEVVARLGRRRVYLVDTPGRTPDESGAVEWLRTLVGALPAPEVILVAPVATEDEELRRLVDGFATLGLEKIVLTRLDEIARPGRLVELARSLPRPVAWVTFGRSARGAGSTPDDPRVIARILGTNLAVEQTA